MKKLIILSLILLVIPVLTLLAETDNTSGKLDAKVEVTYDCAKRDIITKIVNKKLDLPIEIMVLVKDDDGKEVFRDYYKAQIGITVHIYHWHLELEHGKNYLVEVCSSETNRNNLKLSTKVKGASAKFTPIITRIRQCSYEKKDKE